ncbi:hypothetical protein M8J76_005854 [Diaphorina citri]|nr:hypothetical protein M8J76_005854 [Diaphorina citri]
MTLSWDPVFGTFWDLGPYLTPWDSLFGYPGILSLGRPGILSLGRPGILSLGRPGILALVFEALSDALGLCLLGRPGNLTLG